jgi:Cutinase
MFRRITTLTCAATVVGAAFVGLAAGTANAVPGCPDVHWIGAAGSGERVGTDLTAYSGMGRVVYQSLTELSTELQKDGRTLTAEAVDYPAVPVPDDDGGVGAWLGFMGSVDTGAAALGKQYEDFVQQCPTSKVVLAGYSQGAMVVHRNLQAFAASPNLAAVLLVADGDRRPDDPTLNLGTVSGLPKHGKGVAQDWPILAHAPAVLPADIGAKTISVCDLGDAVCDPDSDSDSDKVSARAVAVHTSYARTPGLEWTAPLYFLLGPAPTAPQGPLPGPDARAVNSTTAPAGSNSTASTATMASTAPAADIPAS